MANLTVCDIEEGTEARIKQFRFRKEKTNAALVYKVKDTTIVLDEEYEDMSIEELQEELPSSLPRFVILSYVYKHDDGRVSYPLCFIYIAPVGCKQELNMKYAGTKLHMQKLSGVSKCFELRNLEDFTEEWLLEKLKFFN